MEGVQNPIVALCTPTVTRPFAQCLEALEASVPLLDAAGFQPMMTVEAGNPYISAARATMLRRALDGNAEIIVFIDHDLSWDAGDLLKLVQTPGDVVGGLYRFKKDDEEYMGAWHTEPDGRPSLRPDGCIRATRVSAGFLKVTRSAVERFMRAYPHLCYGSPINPSVDLFNHGAHEGVWWGEDYAFSRNWLACGGEIAVVPDLNLTHHTADKSYPGNLHQYLMRQPGGALAEAA
jgi:glycosyltransferase involved in cell wall biosynthesis